MAAANPDESRSQVRVTVTGTGQANVATGISVLDHLLTLLAELKAKKAVTSEKVH